MQWTRLTSNTGRRLPVSDSGNHLQAAMSEARFRSPASQVQRIFGELENQHSDPRPQCRRSTRTDLPKMFNHALADGYRIAKPKAHRTFDVRGSRTTREMSAAWLRWCNATGHACAARYGWVCRRHCMKFFCKFVKAVDPRVSRNRSLSDRILLSVAKRPEAATSHISVPLKRGRFRRRPQPSRSAIAC